MSTRCNRVVSSTLLPMIRRDYNNSVGDLRFLTPLTLLPFWPHEKFKLFYYNGLAGFDERNDDKQLFSESVMRKKNKRARQIKLFVFFSLLLTLFIILIISTVGRQEFSAPHKLALEVIGTAQYGITRVTGSIKNVWHNYTALVNVREENIRLREELRKHKAINNEYREAVATNIRLAKLLEMKEVIPAPTLTAEIIGVDPSQWFKTIIIDRGSSDGIQVGMPAISIEGVVGQVTNTSPHFAKILLATDPNSALDGLVQTTRVQGIIKGGGNVLHMEYVLKNNEVSNGDRIVTSGLGGVFPKGLPIGTVSKVKKSGRGMFQEIEIMPAADFTQLEHLIIVMKKDPLAK